MIIQGKLDLQLEDLRLTLERSIITERRRHQSKKPMRMKPLKRNRMTIRMKSNLNLKKNNNDCTYL